MVIYLDVLLALNLLIDFLLLEATARWLHCPHRRGRLVLSALFGSAASCLCLLEDPAWLIWSAKPVTALLMVLIGFPWRGIRTYLRQALTLLIVSALFGGLTFLIYFLAEPSGVAVIHGVLYCDISPLALTAMTVGCYGILCVYDRVSRKRMAVGSRYTVEFRWHDRTYRVCALYDTGHHLTEPFSGQPVVIVRREVMGADADDWCTPFAASASSAVTAVRCVPVHTLNGVGLLSAVRPSAMRLCCPSGRDADVTGAFVAVSDQIGRGEYDAIIGTDLVSMVSERR